MKNLGKITRIGISLVGLLLCAAVIAVYLYYRGELIVHTVRAGAVTSCVNESNWDEDFSNCGQIDENGELHINRQLLPKLVRNSESGPACIHANLHVFYLDKTGKSVESYWYEMGCDEFRDGLARSPSLHGTRYFDRSLNIVISTPYQFGFSFNHGYAPVCNNLRTFRPFYDEHRMYKGGECGFIDKRGTLVVPMKYSISEIDSYAPAAYLIQDEEEN